MYRFSFKGFTPRWVMQRTANHWLRQLMANAPKGSQCQARAKKTDSGFLFEVEIHTPHYTYKKKMKIDGAKEERADEVDWQVAAIGRNGQEVIADFVAFMKANKSSSRTNRAS